MGCDKIGLSQNPFHIVHKQHLTAIQPLRLFTQKYRLKRALNNFQIGYITANHVQKEVAAA